MKKGWEARKVEEICEIGDGNHGGNYPKSKDMRASGIPFIRSVNLVDGRISNKDMRYISEEKHNSLKKGHLKTGDVLFTNRGEIGKSAVVNSKFDDANLNSQIAYFRCSNKVLNWYLYYVLQSPAMQNYITKSQTGTALQQFTIRQIVSLKIPLHPIPEQKRIVGILDKAFSAISTAKANAEKNLQNAGELFESYLQGVFANPGDGWEEKRLGEVCEFTQGIQRNVKLQSETQKANKVRFLRIVDFTQGNEPPRYIDNPGEKYILNESDVSLVRYGASTGFVCRGLSGVLANNLFRVIPKSNKELTHGLLFVFLKSLLFQNVIKESMKGAAMPAISFGLIKDIPFPIIPLQEQRAIVQKLDAFSAETKKLEAIYQQKIADLDKLKKSLLQKAFNGEL